MAAEERAVRVPADSAALDADLAVPAVVRGVVLFAHGSGSSRHSSRNRRVAAGLQEAGFATLLMDLLTPEEEQVDLRTRHLRFDIDLLSRRLVAAVDALETMPGTAGLPVATFGASTGAAAALQAAAARPGRVRTVVSRGGRPDLADDLVRVEQPVLLVVGGEDSAVIGLNEQAAEQLAGVHELVVVPGATHLFEEPGALDQVIALTTLWLDRWMPATTGEPT
jgi:putative phosphoribosyl transferase